VSASEADAKRISERGVMEGANKFNEGGSDPAETLAGEEAVTGLSFYYLQAVHGMEGVNQEECHTFRAQPTMLLLSHHQRMHTPATECSKAILDY